MLSKMPNLQCLISWALASGLCLKQHFIPQENNFGSHCCPLSSYSNTYPEKQAQKLMDMLLGN